MTTDTIDPLGIVNPAPRIDNQDAGIFGQTPWQTVGPFFHYGLPWKGGADLVGQSEMGARADLFPEDHYVLNLSSPRGQPEGEVIEIAGFVRDGHGDVVADAMIEIWQANAAGRYFAKVDDRDEVPIDPHFVGWGRSSTTVEGEYRFRTIMPGRVPGPGNSLQAPHLAISVFARGVLKRLSTRAYFAGSDGLDSDPVLEMVPADRRRTLVAQPDGPGQWRLDIVLSGDGETVFFAV